jgi:hypothetical protein
MRARLPLTSGIAGALAAFAAMLTTTGIYHAVFIAQNFGAKVALAVRDTHRP